MTDDELLKLHEKAIRDAMEAAYKRDGFASSGSRESIVAGLRAVAEAALERVRDLHTPTFMPKHNPRAKSCEKRVVGVAWIEPCDVCDGRIARCMCGNEYPCPTIRTLEGASS